MMMRRMTVAGALVALVTGLQGPVVAEAPPVLDLGTRVAYSAVDAVRDTPGGPDAEVDVFTTMVRDGRGWGVDRVTETVGADTNAMAWAPDGARLLVQGSGRFDPPGQVQVVSAFGTPQAVVAEDADSFDWSPDGRRVVLALPDRVWTVTDEGTDPGEILSIPPITHGGEQRQPDHVDVDWTPRSDLFVIEASALFGHHDLVYETWFVEVDSDTITTTRLDDAGTLSPDGAVFAYCSGDELVLTRGDDPNAELGRLAPVSGFTWGPGSDEITFSRSEGGTTELWTADRDGSDPRKLADLPREPESLDGWSPDGRHLALSGRVPGGDLATSSFVALVDDAGTHHERLRAESADVAGWLPDGSGIVYDVAGFDGEPGSDVVVVPVDGAPRPLPNPSEQVRPERPSAGGARIAPTRFADTARVMGRDRIATAVELSRAAFHAAPAVVVARADNYPDALAGTPLAHQLDAPLLLTPGDALDGRVAAEIDRLGAGRAIVLGSDAVVSDEVVARLRAMGLETKRIGGRDRFATAAMIADRLDTSRVFLVEGTHPDARRGWPDAVAVSALAATTGHPVLLTARDQLPAATADWLATNRPDRVTIIGSQVAISDEVVRTVDERAGTVDRIAGTDRYATSARIADAAIDAGLDPSTTLVVTGADWPDALGAGIAAARIGGNLVLAPPMDVTGSATDRWLHRHRDAIDTAAIVGGIAAVAPDAQLDIVRALRD